MGQVTWHGDDLDLDGYLARIGVDADLRPTLTTLAALHRAHGTTSIVASLVTQSIDELDAQVRALAPLVQLIAGWRTVVEARQAYQRLAILFQEIPAPEATLPLPPVKRPTTP